MARRVEDGLALALMGAGVLVVLGGRYAEVPDFSGLTIPLLCLLVGFAALLWAFVRFVRDSEPGGQASGALLRPLDPADRAVAKDARRRPERVPDRLAHLTGQYAQQRAVGLECYRWTVIGMLAVSTPSMVDGDGVLALVALLGWAGFLAAGCCATYLAPRWRRTGTGLQARAEQLST